MSSSVKFGFLGFFFFSLLFVQVVACLRLVIRKCVNGADIQNLLLSVDISADLRRVLVNVLHKNQNQWKEEASIDQVNS